MHEEPDLGPMTQRDRKLRSLICWVDVALWAAFAFFVLGGAQ